MPQIYLATPITSVSEPQRQLIVRWCHRYTQNSLLDKDVFCPAIELEDHTGHRYRTSGPILNFTAGMPDLKASPAVGEHNLEVLKEAGMTEEEIIGATVRLNHAW